MARPLNTKKSWYKVYIKPLHVANIMKKDCEELCDYLYVEAYTGINAISIVQEYIIENEQDYRPIHFQRVKEGEIQPIQYHRVKEGEMIDYGETIH